MTTDYHEPWRRVGDAVFADRHPAGEDPIAEMVGTREARIGHADRICACVNACAGIADPARLVAAATRALGLIEAHGMRQESSLDREVLRELKAALGKEDKS